MRFFSLFFFFSPLRFLFKVLFQRKEKFLACRMRGLGFISVFIEVYVHMKQNLPFPSVLIVGQLKEGEENK